MRIISGQYKGRVLKSTTGPGFRPAMGKVREALFSMLEARGVDWPASRVLDLFAGSGSLGFEALSRGAQSVVFVESAPYAAKIITANATLIGVAPGRFSVIQAEVSKALARPFAAPFQVVFIDPPYQLNLLGAALRVLVERGLLSSGAVVNAEVEARLSFDPASVHAGLETLADRAYGQTRVILWRAK